MTLLPLSVWAVSTPRQPGVALSPPTRSRKPAIPDAGGAGCVGGVGGTGFSSAEMDGRGVAAVAKDARASAAIAARRKPRRFAAPSTPDILTLPLEEKLVGATGFEPAT